MSTEPSSASQPTKRAKLFLSCGQNTDYHERETAKAIAETLGVRGLGFEVFYAPDVQTTKSVVETIFRELRDADYYVFIDFKREKLTKPGKSKPDGHRGSLFTHQEFAIACFLGLPMISFQEKGVEPLQGIVGAVLANSTPFGDREHLARIIRSTVFEKLETGEWCLESGNQLQMSVTPQNGDLADWAGGIKVLHYHIRIQNPHRQRPATSCFAYIQRITDKLNGEDLPIYTCELKWEGTPLQGIRIGPGGMRGLDAFVAQTAPDHSLVFKPCTDAVNHIVQLTGPHQLQVTYVVTSNEFPDTTGTFEIDYDGTRVTRFEISPAPRPKYSAR
ncbi:hypothetical protein [Verrucomicrobium spinosum]|uniref:hypothetical protein n=1 Tax=Verrucomicrobium spinosum TaxID=2736 RepID=UPI0001746AA6|nr:hypothetical protein [Verrucomicrobium spinosum]